MASGIAEITLRVSGKLCFPNTNYPWVEATEEIMVYSKSAQQAVLARACAYRKGTSGEEILVDYCPPKKGHKWVNIEELQEANNNRIRLVFEKG